MIAALFVLEDGPYAGIEGVGPWGITRDARKYRGPHPVVAHPPCERWGRYAKGGPSVRVPRLVGDDEGCFWAALTSVRRYGGIIEHPEASQAFHFFGLPIPKFNGGWTEPDRYGGRSCCVAQGHYGHQAQKMTWLYKHNKSALESYREAKDDLLTLHRLGASSHLRKFFSTTNPIESLNSLLEEDLRRVKRWKNSDQFQRWLATSCLRNEKRMRKIRGFSGLPAVWVRLQELCNHEKTKEIDPEMETYAVATG
jgi:hypothetical protein